MKNIFSVKSLLAITLGVIICLVPYVLVTKSPYIFAIGLAIGIFLSDASTVTRGAVYGSIIAAPVGLYLILSNSLPGEISGEPLLGFLNVTLFVCFGALYGATLIWIKNRLKKGDRPFF